MRSINFLLHGLTQLIRAEEKIEPEYFKVKPHELYKVKETEKIEVADQAVQIHFEKYDDLDKQPVIKEVFLLEVNPLKKGEKYSKEIPPRAGNNPFNPFNLKQIKLEKANAEKLTDNPKCQEKGTYVTYVVRKKTDEEIKKDEEAGIEAQEKPGFYIVIYKNNFVGEEKVAFQVGFVLKFEKKETLYHSFDIFITEKDEDIPKEKDASKTRKTTKVLVARQIDYKDFRIIRKFTEMKEFWFLVGTFSVCFVTFVFFFLKT